MPITDPTDIAGCKLWLDASEPFSINLANNAKVPLWSDLSGNGYDVTQADVTKQPTFKRRVVNGKSSLYFDGERLLPNVLTRGVGYPVVGGAFNFNAAGQMTWFMVGKSDRDVGHSFWEQSLGQGSFNLGPFFFYPGSGRTSVRYPFGGSFTDVAEALNPVVPPWHGFRSYSGKWDQPINLGVLYRDGIAVATRTDLPNISNLVAERLDVGDGTLGRNAGTRPLRGYMSLLLMYDTPLSDPDRLDVEAWIQDRWFTDDQHRRSVGTEVPN